MPKALDGVIGPTIALMQKGLRAEEDFVCAARVLDDYAGTASFAAFRQSFATLAICYRNANDFPEETRLDLFRPGFLAGYPV